MSAAAAVAVAVTFVWLGMVFAISFLEAPLKFRAPGITLPLGLGIGRLVFRALNACEALFAVMLVATMIIGGLPVLTVATGVLAVATLVAQLVVVRPRLTWRTQAVLAGSGGSRDGEAPRSRAHLGYVGLEAIKVSALLICGITLLV